MCFERVCNAEEECIQKYQLKDVCTTNHLQKVRRVMQRSLSNAVPIVCIEFHAALRDA
jgi:hypothetical protein